MKAIDLLYGALFISFFSLLILLNNNSVLRERNRDLRETAELTAYKWYLNGVIDGNKGVWREHGSVLDSIKNNLK